jgi:hypothetical protein
VLEVYVKPDANHLYKAPDKNGKYKAFLGLRTKILLPPLFRLRFGMP